ncbi:hypothetical protein M3591_12310 [Exiguobacterium sp. MER 193]|uniref:hypothetical protein n=1 Tax=Exiguobacterium sp. MER 193 TaxID=2939564 RepID=UPI0020410C8D|nr:hypothetical protein [Exiguobacterium sp. MER 193]MCM3281297.1 hypothetical protein [Exiguobacterium sp. MER 193]
MNKMMKWVDAIRTITAPFGDPIGEIENEEVECVMVAESTVRGIMNPEVKLEFHELSQVRVCSSEEIEDIEIEVAPDFDLLLQFKGGKQERYQLWLGQPEHPSVITEFERTDVIWRLPEHSTNQLIDALGLDT